MTLHHYPLHNLLADYARAAVGVGITAVPLIASGSFGVVAAIILAVMMLFLVYGLRTLIRQFTRIEVSEAGIRALGPIGRAIAWDEVRDISLRYYSTRRDRRKGWLQLSVKGPGGAIGMDSQLDEFHQVLESVFREVSGRGVTPDEATLENLKLFEENRDKPA